MGKWNLRDELVLQGFSFGLATRLILNGNVTICKTGKFTDRVTIKRPRYQIEVGDWIHVTRKNRYHKYLGRKLKYMTSCTHWVFQSE